MQEALNFAQLMGIGIFLFPIIVFILWLYFGFGNLTRLTDIKYKLDELLYTLKDMNSDNTKPSNEAASKVPSDALENVDDKLQTENTVKKSRNEAVRIATYSIAEDIKKLKKPSSLFIVLLISFFLVCVTIIGITLATHA
ncbi:MAG TPA: hypothetical protein PLZ58_02900 [Candidatus Saccharibacteria bacterium]|nr:hypothetical protein [Candidatus Saccharibacteria bacterium]HRQ06719.1 hypothetical protein [Candidatus Saccharibacteria bacterium]